MVARSPRSASMAFAAVSLKPTSRGTLTVGMVVGRAVEVVGTVVATVGKE